MHSNIVLTAPASFSIRSFVCSGVDSNLSRVPIPGRLLAQACPSWLIILTGPAEAVKIYGRIGSVWAGRSADSARWSDRPMTFFAFLGAAIGVSVPWVCIILYDGASPVRGSDRGCQGISFALLGRCFRALPIDQI